MGKGEGKGDGKGSSDSCCFRFCCFPCYCLEGICTVICDALTLVFCCPCRCCCGCPKMPSES